MENNIFKRMEELRRQSELTAIGLVHVEFTVARTNMNVAKSRKALGLPIDAYLHLARHALGVAEKVMWRFRTQHYEFNEMVALAERARMELEALEDAEAQGG